MFAAIFAVLFGLSLLPGRKPLCVRFAERISEGILPDGAIAYCRRLTWVWFGILTFLTLSNVACVLWVRPAVGPRFGWAACLVPTFYALLVIPLVFFVEGRIRRRRFSVTFHTSGSTGGPKTIVKTFESMAKETAAHCRRIRRSPWFAQAGDVRFVTTIDHGHFYGALWRGLVPKALGLPCDPELVRSPESLLAKMAEAKSVFLVTTPSFLDRFTAYAGDYSVPRNCVEIVTSGALLTRDVALRTKAVFGLAPLEVFGSTETGGVALRRQSETPVADGFDWEVMEGVRISDDGGRIAVESPYCFRRRYTMGDGAAISPDARRFRLLGRMDRLVKINEERVNLAEMEEKVAALGFREVALAKLEGAHGPYLGAVLVAAADGVEKPAVELRRLMLPVFPKGTVPKRFRYVRAIPRNPQGKAVAAEIVRILESGLVEPQFLACRRGSDFFEGDVRFDPSAAYFQGHFPGFPLLPGVVQIGLAVRYAKETFAVQGALREVRRMKFKTVIRPGDRVRIRLDRTGDGQVSYLFAKGEATCSQGVLVF